MHHAGRLSLSWGCPTMPDVPEITLEKLKAAQQAFAQVEELMHQGKGGPTST